MNLWARQQGEKCEPQEIPLRRLSVHIINLLCAYRYNVNLWGRQQGEKCEPQEIPLRQILNLRRHRRDSIKCTWTSAYHQNSTTHLPSRSWYQQIVHQPFFVRQTSHTGHQQPVPTLEWKTCPKG